MLGSTLIDVVNAAMEDTRNWVEDEMNLRRSVACAEVQGIIHDKKGRMKCGFSYSTMFATGAAESDDKYRDFLLKVLHDTHMRLLNNETSPSMSWESSPVTVGHIRRTYKHDNCEYSIAVGVLGGTREENQTIVDAIVSSIPENG